MNVISGSDASDGGWGDFLFAIMPGRMQTGYAGAFFTFTPATIANTVELLANNALMARHVSHEESPDDILNYIGSESGMIKYFSESNADFRTRILNKWNTLPTYGTEQCLTSSLYVIGYQNFVSVSLDFNTLGTDVTIGAANPGGSTIIPYLPSSQNHYQFNVIIEVSQVNSPAGNIESRMIPDAQLTSIRSHIDLLKPADFYCPEIVLLHYGSGSDSYPFWNRGETWEGGAVWGGAMPSSSSFRMERHKA